MTTNESASLAELLCALSFVSDIGMGQPMGHGLKTAYVGLRIADETGLSLEDRQAIFYGALLKDAGCTACAGVFSTFFAGDDLGPRNDCLMLRPDSVTDAVGWFWRHSPNDDALPARIGKLFTFLMACKSVMKESVAAHCEVGEMFARRLSLPQPVQRTIRYAMERWDGKGMAYGLKAADVPATARILHLAQVTEVAHCFGGRQASEAIARERRGTDFDPDVVDGFLRACAKPDFWPGFEKEPFLELPLQMRPQAPFDALSSDNVDNVCELLADFADVKSRLTWDHSRIVAETALATGASMSLGSEDLSRLRRSALVHDLGKAAVPLSILDQGNRMSAADVGAFELHPYYTERVLSQVAPLSYLADEASSHHEHLDGSGYHKRLKGEQIALGGRVLAVADAYTLLARASVDPEQALTQMKPQIGSHLDRQCYEGLVAALRGSPATVQRKPVHPGNLTEREIEVLRSAARGLSNREIARDLVISEKTVEHHLEHVFDKLDVTSRTAAVVFAVQNGLAP